MEPLNMESRVENRLIGPGSRHYSIVMNVLNTVTQLCLGAVLCSAFVAANRYGEQVGILSNLNISTSQHIYLNATGYFLLMTQAILTFNPHAGWAVSLMYPTKRIVHYALQICGAILVFVGSGIKLLDAGTNFATPHAILGFATLVLTAVNLVGGVVHIILPNLMQNKMLKMIHGLVGLLAILCAFITICLAFHTNYRSLLGNRSANMAIAFAALALAGIMLRQPGWRRELPY